MKFRGYNIDKGSGYMTEDEIIQDSKVIAQIVDDMYLFDGGFHIVYVNGG
jgi:hypothetical protein